MQNKSLVAILAASTIVSGGFALAANQPPPAVPPGHAAVVNDFGKLSADAAHAYQDVARARLAIYDGRVADAKKFVSEADAGFNKAKTDDSVFTKAEADLRTRPSASKPSNQAAPGQNAASAASNGQQAVPPANDQAAAKPIAWLPVDGTVSLTEDYSLQPAKAKAVTDANSSLAKGDRKGAMEKLKLAGVDVDTAVAVVPLQQTISDVHDAAQLIDSGKYYEGSQKLRAVQTSTVITVADMPRSGAAKPPAGKDVASPPAPTH